MIRFACACGQSLQAPDDHAGREVSCPACARRQGVPPAGADAFRTDLPRPAAAEGVPDVRRPGVSDKATASLVLGVLSFFCTALTGVPAVVLGLLALRDVGRSRGRLVGQGRAVAGLATAAAGTLLSGFVLLPALVGVSLAVVQETRQAAQKRQSQNNLEQIGTALHAFHADYKYFPPAAICTGEGRPLLSWRVAVLPYLGEGALYDQFRFDEPWDGPSNIRLLERMPRVYSCPAAAAPPGQTVYRVFYGNGAAFEWMNGVRMTEFPDGLANTLLVVEAARPVPWTKPDELPYDPDGPLPPLGGHTPRGFHAVAGDGTVHFIADVTPERTLRPLITRDDGQFVRLPPP